jgi:LuxR family transcriptional regulator, maltose regulon positive regulatory protein
MSVRDSWREQADSFAGGQELWRVEFFGCFTLICNDSTVALGRCSKARSLIKFLLAQNPRPVSQDHLMGWLWPESNLRRARSALGSTVHTLRKALNSRLPQRADSTDCLVFKDGQYSIHSDVRVSSDTQRFSYLYRRGCHLEDARQIQEAAKEYERAIELYKGDYLVEDLDEDWTMVERERLAHAYVYALDRVAGYQLATGQLRKCIESNYRLLEKDYSHEESYRRLMRCYARLGLRFRVLEQYRLCQKVLRQAFRISPSPETQSLYQEIVSKGATAAGPTYESGFIHQRVSLP